MTVATPSAEFAQPCELHGIEAAYRHVELVTGDRDCKVHFRLIHDDKKRNAATIKRFGTPTALWPELTVFQGQGYGVFIGVNEGGDCDHDINRIRAVFVDADNVPLPSVWHLPPHFIVQRDATHWHAYWRVLDLPVSEFRNVQRRLAAHYGTDAKVCNPSRVMRLAGTLHQKVVAP